MSSVGAAVGRGVTVEHGGRAYDLAPVDHVGVIAGYEDHLRQRALNSVNTVYKLMGGVAGDKAMRAYVDNDAQGVYEFGSPYWLEGLQFAPNQKALIFECMRAKDRSVTRALAEDVWRSQPEQVARLIYGDAAPVPADGDPGKAGAPGSAAGTGAG